MLTVAQVAGILAAKRTSELIPLCHPVYLNKVDVRCVLLEKGKYESSSNTKIIFILYLPNLVLLNITLFYFK